MLTSFEITLAKKYRPIVLQDENETISIRFVGISVFNHKELSKTWNIPYDPSAWSLKYIIEYAYYWDYDIQHLYDLEHIVVGVKDDGSVGECCSSFHGLIVHSSAMDGMYHVQGSHPVLYMQPGKHAFMADPFLFQLDPTMTTCCNINAGGGLLVPQMLAHRMSTTPERDEKIRSWIRKNYSFEPSWKYVPVPALQDEQLVSADELLDKIPDLVAEQLKLIEGTYPDFYRG